MADDDASSAEMHRLPTNPDADPLALDDETVERLLRGELSPDQAPPGYAEVAQLLAAATAPPSAGELSGQAAALAELRAVTRPRRAAIGTRRAARQRRRRTGLAIVVVAGALVTGSVAGAATGHLPGPVRDAARSFLPSPGDGTPGPATQPASPPSPGTTGGPASTGATTGPQSSQPTGTDDRGPASTAAGLDNKGLCQAYLAGEGGEQGKKLDTPALQALARAAGGEGKIAGYCADLLPGQAKPKDEEDKSPPGDQGQGQGPGQGGAPPSSGPGQEERAPGASAPGR